MLLVKLSECLCVFGFYGAIYIYILIFLLTSFSLPFSEPSLVGLALDLAKNLTRKVVPKMTCTVSRVGV